MNRILLDRNEHQYGPSPACYEVLRMANLEDLSLYSRDYTRGIKSELSHRLSKMMGIPEERIVLSYGSEDMLKQAVHCYLTPGSAMLIPRQSWWYYKSVAAEVRGEVVEYSLHVGANEFVYDPHEIMALYDTYRPRVILLASPNNPTGNSLGDDMLAALADHCGSSVIILDEAYTGFSGQSSINVTPVLSVHDRLLVLRTFSKYYALAGLRIGYACLGAGLDELVRYSSRYLGYNRLSEKIALAALEDEGYYRKVREQMNRDKLRYYETFASMRGFTAFRSDANFLLVRFPPHLASALRDVFEKRNIMVKFYNDPVMNNCFRITIGTTEQNDCVLSALTTIAGQPLPAIPFLAAE